VIAGRGWTVRVAEVVHVQPQLRCLAYRLEADSGAIVFGGDSAPTAALTELAQGADVLLHMCHFVNGAIADPRLTESCSGHLDAARTARDAGEIFKGSIVFAEDLLQVPLEDIAVEDIR
jgi:ribonuclease Z